MERPIKDYNEEDFDAFVRIFQPGVKLYGENAHEHYHNIMKLVLEFDINKLYRYREEFINLIRYTKDLQDLLAKGIFTTYSDEEAKEYNLPL